MNNNHNNKFFDGFLWGAIIGGGLVFLLGTKKGKKILKMITEEGVGGLSEILQAQMDEGDLEEEEEMENMIETPEEPILNGNGVTKNNSEPVVPQPEVKKGHKRFFRRASK